MENQLDKLWQASLEKERAVKKEMLIHMPDQIDEEGLFEWFKTSIPKLTHCMDEVEMETGIKCVCQKGCGGCCRQAIQVLGSEAQAIKVKLREFSREEKQALYERVIHTISVIERSGLDTDFSHYYSAKGVSPQLMQFMEGYFKLGLSCPLLSEEGACMIYEVRPGGCWGYRVYGEAENCARSFYNLNGIHFENWENYLLKVLYRKSGTVEALKLLPYWLLDILEAEIKDESQLS